LAATNDIDPRLLRLHPNDNVLTVIAPLAAGERISIDGEPVALSAALGIGHKVAAEAIAAGAKIVKYGAPIGSATRDIAPGEHVHTHNVQSDYLPTFLREDQGRYFAQHQQQQ
jgi:hypothetical protein